MVSNKVHCLARLLLLLTAPIPKYWKKGRETHACLVEIRLVHLKLSSSVRDMLNRKLYYFNPLTIARPSESPRTSSLKAEPRQRQAV